MSSRGGGTAGVVRLEKCVLERVKGASWWLYVHDCIYRSDTNNSRCCIRQPERFGSSYSELIFANIPEEYIFNWSDWISLKKYPVWQQMLFSSVCPQLVYFFNPSWLLNLSSSSDVVLVWVGSAFFQLLASPGVDYYILSSFIHQAHIIRFRLSYAFRGYR